MQKQKAQQAAGKGWQKKERAEMKKKLLSAALALALCLMLLPGTALAAEADWAKDAVDKLNGIYGENLFSANDGTMTVAELNTLMEKTGWETDKVSSDDSGNLSRGTACEVLADVFGLPVPEGKTAIQYLYDQNIISGKANGNLAESDPVTKAEFTVLTYRVLNSVGGGKGSGVEGLKPGTPGYTAWMYLAVRKCVPFVVKVGEGENVQETPINVNQKIGEAKGIETYAGSSLKQGHENIYDVSTATKDGEAIWNAWEDALQDPNIGGIKGFSASNYSAEDTLLEAATKIVGQFMDQKTEKKDHIFHDVTPDNWFYDGIMYLANQNIVIGYGDGQFGPNDTAPRFQFAILLSIMDGTISSTDTSPQRITTAINHVREAKYLNIPDDVKDEEFSTDPYWSAPTTREEAAVGILKMIEKKYSIDTTSDNLSILDRFNDAEDIADVNSKPYLAYAVSMGLLSGTSENTLDPDGSVSRAQVGVLLYRTLIGLDTSKMQDYRENVSYVLSAEDSGAAAAPAEQGIALFAAPLTETRTGTAAALDLREDWRLTDILALNVPADTTLTIGGGYHIYEMTGRLKNNGAGTVRFADGTILYPAAADTDAQKISVDGIWDTKESNALMVLRANGYSVTVASAANGTVAADKLAAKEGDTVTLAVQPASGYELDTLSVKTQGEDGKTIETTGSGAAYTFAMPGGDVTVTATFKAATSTPSSPGGGGGSSGSSTTTTETTANPDGSITTTVTNNATGTVTETTRQPDGSTEVVETKKDGTVTTTITDADGNETETVETPDGASETTMDRADGTSSTTTVSAEGQVEAEVILSAAVVAAAAESGEAAALPLPALPVTADRETAPAVTVSLPGSAAARVEIPVEGATPGVVVLLVAADGTETILKDTVTDETGVDVTLKSGDTVKIVDNTKTFSDVPDSYWGANAVAFAASRELFNGTAPATFSPEAAMNRAMIVTVLARYEGVDTDTGDAWYMAGAAWAVETGISDRSKLPGTLTREQLATMLYRYAQYKDYDTALGGMAVREFSDYGSISDYAAEAVSWAVDAGILNGVGGNRLAPQGSATRAQVAAMLMRFIEYTAR